MASTPSRLPDMSALGSAVSAWSLGSSRSDESDLRLSLDLRVARRTTSGVAAATAAARGEVDEEADEPGVLDTQRSETTTSSGVVSERMPGLLPVEPSTRVVHAKKAGWKTVLCTSKCHHDVVPLAASDLLWETTLDTRKCHVLWNEVTTFDEALLPQLGRFQKVSRFPGMNLALRKCELARYLNRLRMLFPTDYDFFPLTWVLPGDAEELAAHSARSTKGTYIFKPDMGSQGDGIIITKQPGKVQMNKFKKDVVVQKYIAKPLLIEDLKFDLRLYVLVTSVAPLRVYLHSAGLARFCTEAYEEPTQRNMREVYKHLTNYSLNKMSENFVANTDAESCDTGSKRSLSFVMRFLEEHGHDTDKLWEDIKDVVAKTMIAIQPMLMMHYGSTFGARHTNPFQCFQVLGFDVLLDHQLKPWLLEVNNSPSLMTDAPLDEAIKRAVVSDSFDMIDLSGVERRMWHGAGSAFTRAAQATDTLQSVVQCRCDHEDARLPGTRYSQVLPSSSGAHYSHFMLFQSPDLLSVFAAACGARHFELTSSKFARFVTLCKLHVSASASTTFSRAEADLLFVRLTRPRGLASLGFFDFCNALLDISQRMYPDPSPLASLLALLKGHVAPAAQSLLPATAVGVQPSA